MYRTLLLLLVLPALSGCADFNPDAVMGRMRKPVLLIAKGSKENKTLKDPFYKSVVLQDAEGKVVTIPGKYYFSQCVYDTYKVGEVVVNVREHTKKK